MVDQFVSAKTAPTVEQDLKLGRLSNKDIMPNIQIDDKSAQPLMADTDCYLQASNAALRLQITTITAFDLSSSNLQRSSRCFVGGSEGMYMSPNNVYLTSSRHYSFDLTTDLSTRAFKPETTTDIHKFGLQGQTITYKGSGTVQGHLGWDKDKLAYRMSEYQGDLRVLSFTGSTGWAFPVPMPQGVIVTQGGAVSNLAGSSTLTLTAGTGTAASPTSAAITPLPASPATLTILREISGKGLQTVGSLPNSQRPAAIGLPGEQVYAVKFVGPRAYVVTFRQTDSLYVLDVSNPTDPKTLGELSMPGFSDYLYPLGDSLLLGVGKDASASGLVEGVKVALMDVSNPASPTVLNSLVVGKRGSSSTLDFTSHGINVFQRDDVYRIALPVRVHETPSKYILSPQMFFQPTYQGLQRFEVDAAAKTLVSKPAVKSIEYDPNDPYTKIGLYGVSDIAHDRSVQIESKVYYFSGGRFISASW